MKVVSKVLLYRRADTEAEEERKDQTGKKRMNDVGAAKNPMPLMNLYACLYVSVYISASEACVGSFLLSSALSKTRAVHRKKSRSDGHGGHNNADNVVRHCE